MINMNISQWRTLLRESISLGTSPCHAAAVGRGDEVYFTDVYGNRTEHPEPLPLSRSDLFDMASMTKIMATTPVALRLYEEGLLDLDAPLSAFFDAPADKRNIRVRQLMAHVSGLPAHLPLWRMDIKPEKVADTILRAALAAPTGSKVIYSCMGFILLGKIVEQLGGDSLDVLAKRYVFDPLGMTRTTFCPSPDTICVATEKKEGRTDYICGAVHDENARFMGGVSGNAGLFAPLDDVIRYATMLSKRGEGLLKRETFESAVQDATGIADDPRGLGLQLFGGGTYPGGSRMSLGSYGHTGYTGTSLYVDNDTGVWAVLLTNRVHYGRDRDIFFVRRRLFYDTIFG
jgi:CubicO group peptidase (beta-lactamase class C family)